jgi:hypothetical protein
MRILRAFLAILTSLAAIFAIVLVSAGSASADSERFYDRYNDVRTPNDIRWVNVDVDYDLRVDVKMRSLPRGEIGMWIDTGGDRYPEFFFYGDIRGNDYTLYYTDEDSWTGDEEVDEDCYSYDTRPRRSIGYLEVDGDCAPDDAEGVRVSVGTSYLNRDGDYVGTDYAPRYHRYTRWVYDGEEPDRR